jgi:lipopolysaccharide cholinephosphotransferase
MKLTQKNHIEYYTIINLEKFQVLIFELLQIVDSVCKKNNLSYWIDGGTLIGAVRHHGFIPWDDDLDLCLMKKDFDKLMLLLYEEIQQSPDKHLMFYKNKDVKHWCEYLYSTKIFSKIGRQVKPCRIDIHPMKAIPKSCIAEDKKITEIATFFIYGKNKYPNMLDKTYRRYLKLPLSEALKKKKEFMSYFNDTYMVSHCNATKDCLINYPSNDFFVKESREYYSYENIFPLKTITFEGMNIPCPNNIHDYLTKLYGDYNSLPPLKNRIPVSEEIIINDTGVYSYKDVDNDIINYNSYFYIRQKFSYKLKYVFLLLKEKGVLIAMKKIINYFVNRI